MEDQEHYRGTQGYINCMWTSYCHHPQRTESELSLTLANITVDAIPGYTYCRPPPLCLAEGARRDQKINYPLASLGLEPERTRARNCVIHLPMLMGPIVDDSSIRDIRTLCFFTSTRCASCASAYQFHFQFTSLARIMILVAQVHHLYSQRTLVPVSTAYRGITAPHSKPFDKETSSLSCQGPRMTTSRLIDTVRQY